MPKAEKPRFAARLNYLTGRVRKDEGSRVGCRRDETTDDNPVIDMVNLCSCSPGISERDFF